MRITTLPAPEPYLNTVTPDRARSDRHAWTFGGKKYALYFGDFHRHTDVSNCITGNDGCINEQFRYVDHIFERVFQSVAART